MTTSSMFGMAENVFFAAAAVVVQLIVLSLPVTSYRILMFPLPPSSHVYSLAAIADGLIDWGHSVSMLVARSFQLNDLAVKNRTDISYFTYEDPMVVNGQSVYQHAIQISEQGQDQHALSVLWSQYSKDLCTTWTTDKDNILDDLEKERFDLVVLDGLLQFSLGCIYLIPHRLGVPWITYSDTINAHRVRVPWLPSFVPIDTLPLTDAMTFFDRLTNFVAYLPTESWLPSEMTTEYQQYGAFGSVDELASRSLLWLYTKDYVLDYPHPLMPNIIDVGGLTAKPSNGRIRPAVKEFIEGAEKGAILFAFGSSVSRFPLAMAEKFLAAFRRLDGYRVVWKMNNEDDVEIPNSVMIADWLPQNDILAHPAVKLFITHCGNNGQYEAVYHGVPMLGLPLYGDDQKYNARRMEHRGYGLSMDIHDFTAEELFDNLRTILRNESYKEHVTKASEIFRSQSQSPVERATFWIEHVCRFGGDHLHSAGSDLPLYSYFMLDVLAFFVITAHIFVCLLYRLAKCIANRCSKYLAKTGRPTPVNKND